MFTLTINHPNFEIWPPWAWIKDSGFQRHLWFHKESLNIILASVSHSKSSALKKSYWLFGLKMNSSKPIIENLVPGAQYQVVMYLRKGPLIGPPSDPVTFAIGKSPDTRIITLSRYCLERCNVQAQLIIIIYGRPILVHPISYLQNHKLLKLYSWRASLAFIIWGGGVGIRGKYV